MKKKYIEYISATLLILFGIWGWYETSTWTIADGGALSPTTYPRILFTCVLGFGLFILGRTLYKVYVVKKAEALEIKLDLHLVGVIATIVALLIYILVMQYIGFLIATSVYLFVAMAIFGERKWLRMAIISVAGSVVLYLFFVQFMGVAF